MRITLLIYMAGTEKVICRLIFAGGLIDYLLVDEIFHRLVSLSSIIQYSKRETDRQTDGRTNRHHTIALRYAPWRGRGQYINDVL